MLAQSNGKMFLAGTRGYSEQNWFRSYNTFNFGTFQNEDKTPFGALYVLNDDTLAGGRSLIQFIEEDTIVVLLPTVGTITYSDTAGHQTLIEAGQMQQHNLQKGTTFEIGNPYQDDLVHFIQIWIKGAVSPTFSIPQCTAFDLKQSENTLLSIIPAEQRVDSFNLCIGKFTGREEIAYHLSGPRNGVFVFVLQGAFEVQHRLLESRDGLALWNTPQIEMEALSNDAVVLLLEVPLVD